MADTVNTLGGISAQAPVGASAAIVVDPKKTEAGNSNPIITARFYNDPLAGGVLVSQQLDGQGDIIVQTPPRTVIAYLRNGLTIQGYTKNITA